MLTNFRTLLPDDPLAKAVEHVLDGWQQDFPVVFGDHVLGMLTREDLMRALARGGMDTPVRDAMNRDFVTVDSHEMLEKALATMRAAKCRSVPVLHDGSAGGFAHHGPRRRVADDPDGAPPGATHRPTCGA